MQPCFEPLVSTYHPQARESDRLPADIAYAVPYAKKRCWRGDDWWIAEQTYDARHAYVYLLEVHTDRELRFGVKCLRRDLRWLYPLRGEFRIHGADGGLALRLAANEHVRVLTGAGTHGIRLPPGRHLLVAFVLEWGWPRRYARNALGYLRKPLPMPITPAIRGLLLTLASLPQNDGMVMDAEIYRPIARITQLTRQHYAETHGADGTASRSLQLANAMRDHIRDLLALGGKPPTIAKLAEHFGVSPDHLSRTHKKHYGVPAQGFLTRHRLDVAYGLLCDDGLSVSEVTYRLDFTDVQGFNKLFRKYFGEAPNSVRKR